MTTEENPSYFITLNEQTRSIELQRLLHQDTFLTEAMGGPLPELIQQEDESVQDVLDLGCGPGGWAMALVQERYEQKRNIRVTGLDNNPTVIAYAQEHAKSSHLEHVTFQVADILDPNGLPFDDNQFDLVNARLFVSFMTHSLWPKLLAECHRVLRPGGILRLTECEVYQSSSPAFEQLYQWLVTSLNRDGKGFSPGEYHLNIHLMLKQFLKNAGFENVKMVPYLIDGSYDQSDHEAVFENTLIFFPLLFSTFERVLRLSKEVFQKTYEQALQEMQQPDFACMGLLTTAWGYKRTNS